MKTNSRRNGIIPNRHKSLLPKKIRKPLYGGFDDFLNRLAALKERGDLVISGKRIC